MLSRRDFLRAAAVAPLIGCRKSSAPGIRIREIAFKYEDYLYRTPIKFGGLVLDRVTLLNVDCIIEDASGRTAKGSGSMPLGNIWSFPSRKMPYEATLGAMKALAARIY